MTYGYDDATFTEMSGVTEVQINSGASLTAPDPAHGLLAVIPYLSERTGSCTFSISTRRTIKRR